MTFEKKDKEASGNLSTRELALRCLCRVESDAAYAGRVLDGARLDSRMDQRETALLSQLVKGTLQRRGTVDAALEKYLKEGLQSLPLKIRNILRLGAYQIIFLDRIPAEVAVNEAVNLAKKQKERNLAGLVNAVLRTLVQNLPELMQSLAAAGSAEEIAVSGSHPLWLIERWISQIGAQETRALCAADNRIWPLQLRANTLRISAGDLLGRLRREGIKAVPGRYCSDCLSVENLAGNKKLHELESFKAGLFQVQDESSALISLLVGPQAGETVVDLCSAPGGKTTHLAQLMCNSGRLIAADVNRRRLKLVKESCRRLGISITEYAAADGRRLSLEFESDRVLVDAPCSGLGALGRKSDARWNKSPQMFADLAKLQLELLSNAARLVKKGGILVYSTCSIDLQEDEQLAEEFLSCNSGFRLRPPPADFSSFGMTTSQGYYRSWPQRHFIGGAFGAVFLRIS